MKLVKFAASVVELFVYFAVSIIFFQDMGRTQATSKVSLMSHTTNKKFSFLVLKMKKIKACRLSLCHGLSREKYR
jgi:hypothetical protein